VTLALKFDLLVIFEGFEYLSLDLRIEKRNYTIELDIVSEYKMNLSSSKD